MKTIKLIFLFVVLFETQKIYSQSCTASINYTPNANGNAAFLCTASPATVTTTYSWNFGNGVTQSFTGTPTTNFTYTVNATYTVSVIACNGNSCCPAALIITITNAPTCSLNSSFSYSQGTNGAVNFTNTSTGTNTGTIYNFSVGTGVSYSIGSGTFSATYPANGIYTVSLYASNNSSPTCQNTFTTTININSICNLSPTINYSLGANGLVNYSCSTSGTLSNPTYTFHFGDGSPSSITSNSAGSHLYTNGYYMLFVEVSATQGINTCYSSNSTYVTITNNSCVISSAFTHTLGTNGVVQFSHSATNANTNYTWNFGDGTFSNSSNPSHTYLNAGTHYVLLYTQNSLYTSCHDSITQAINITGIPCVANSNFSIQPTNTLHYYNLIPAYPYNVSAVLWNWGDGLTSNYLYASHTYSAAGNYDICLTVTTSCGSTSSVCSTQYLAKGIDGTMVNVNVVAPSVVSGISVNNKEENAYELFPNPSDGILNIVFNPNSKAERIEVYDLLGKKVSTAADENTLLQNTEEKFTLDLSQLENGIYFLRINSNNKISTEKFIIAK